MSPIRKTTLVLTLLALGVSQSGCLAAAAIGVVAGTAIGVTGKAVGMTAKGAGKVVGAALPGGEDKDEKKKR